jgi:hypothetical protein
MRHPGKNELMAYAQSLTDDCSTISVRIAGHVAKCSECQVEVEAIRTTFRIAKLGGELNPNEESTLRILKAAREERELLRQQPSHPTFWTAVKCVGYAAGILLVSGVCFGFALSPRSSSSVSGAMIASEDVGSAVQLSPEALRRATEEIRALSAAVNAPSKNPPSALELERRKAVNALTKELEAARSALARNPGCERAMRVMDSNLQRQAQTLRALYADRSL